MAIEVDRLPTGDGTECGGEDLLDDGVIRHLGADQYQSSIDFLSLFWCDPAKKAAGAMRGIEQR